jgi:hypothetical protein
MTRFAPLFALGLGVLAVSTACLATFGPDIRSAAHHASVTAQTDDAVCLGCHEPEQRARTRLASMTRPQRERAMHRMMHGGGAPLVAQWMIDDARTCVTCHAVRGGER